MTYPPPSCLVGEKKPRVVTSSASRSRMARPPRNGLMGLSKLSKKMAGEALGLTFSIATLTSGQMPMGRTASVESVL